MLLKFLENVFIGIFAIWAFFGVIPLLNPVIDIIPSPSSSPIPNFAYILENGRYTT